MNSRTTRRPVILKDPKGKGHGTKRINGVFEYYIGDSGWKKPVCPYGVIGDRMWVREAWAVWKTGPKGKVIMWPGPIAKERPEFPWQLAWRSEKQTQILKWKPSLHMPKWACGIFLEITDVRVERLQEISNDDIMREGVPKVVKHMALSSAGVSAGGVSLAGGVTYHDPRDAMRITWDGMYSGDTAWAANPWVWAIDFKVTV